MKTSNCPTLTSNPWNEGFKPSDSHPTHGMKASNHLTLTSNPWNEGFKLSDSHIQPMEQRPQTIQLSRPTHGTKAQTIQLPHTTHGTKTSNRHPIPMEQRLQTIRLPHTTHGTSNLAK